MGEPRRLWTDAAELDVDLARARLFEHGWQSWSPTTVYALDQAPWRPADSSTETLAYRPDSRPPAGSFQGEGLLAVDPGTGDPPRIWAAADPTRQVASIRATVRDGRLLVAADGPVTETVAPASGGGAGDADTGGLQRALGGWADGLARSIGVDRIRPAPTGWCSWYHYFTHVTEQDVLENVDSMAALNLPVEVVQIDDGYQAEIGDWLELSGRFASLATLVARIRDRGRRAGIWVAPFLAGAHSALVRDHPDWVLPQVSAGHHWDQDLAAVDITVPAAASYLQRVFSTFGELGIDYFKIDFIYAGALPGRRRGDLAPIPAYRHGLALIREAIGADAYLLGCGAPILASVGCVDAMRVSPDTGLTYQPPSADLSKPAQRSAAMTGRARAFTHGRWWVNDPDCLVVRPGVERREEWAAHVERYGGLRASGDRLSELDGWGLDVTQRLLSSVPPPVPFELD